MIYFGAPDGFLLALDAQTGKLRWETKVDDGQITAGGLLVADGKVISNRTCEQGKREFCFIAAHDAQNRQRGLEVLRHGRAWRAGRRHLGQRAGRPAGRRSVGPAWFVRSGAQGRLLGRGQPQSVHALQTLRPLRHRRADLADGALQQLDAWRSTSRPASWSGTSRSCPATTGTPTTTRNAFWFAPA